MITMIYHSPMQFDAFLDATSQLELVGVDPYDAYLACLQGIHHRMVDFFIDNWIQAVQYDFPHQTPEQTDITFRSWYHFLSHYTFIIEQHLSHFVKPLPQIPNIVLVAEMNYDKMVIQYAF